MAEPNFEKINGKTFIAVEVPFSRLHKSGIRYAQAKGPHDMKKQMVINTIRLDTFFSRLANDFCLCSIGWVGPL